MSEFHNLEESLKEFLSAQQANTPNAQNINLYKYNNLKIFMMSKQNKNPHFIVRMGISETVYSLNNGEKLSGGLGADERWVRKWFENPINKASLQELWKRSLKVETVQVDTSEEE
ncbi:MAG TPA: hypothetical protein PLG15_03955 [Candidatus Gastranaerophilaceae bacterium]|nr:hypothetical protein [Candidatus Gastranaerophilaceae bacterium]HPT41519.1 hypothetical protein [Candidatus Gastranaerophilaceae bacterium]